MTTDILRQIDELSKKLGFRNNLEHDLLCNEHIELKKTYHKELKKSDCLLFCGNNLTHLINLSINHNNSIGICYIDPPYNTGKKFIYNDVRKNTEFGPFGTHTAWMSFMLPRLTTIKEILKEDGVIAISIDDYELYYLKILLDHVFGEENFIANIVSCRSRNGKGSKKNIASNHEYLLIYGKSKLSSLRGSLDNEKNYNKTDKYGKFRIDGIFRKKGEDSRRSDRPNMYFPLYYNNVGEVFVDNLPGLSVIYPIDSKGEERRWLWSKETTEANLWKLYASPNGTIYVKNYLSNDKRIKIRTLWDNPSYFTERATNEIKEIFGDKVFDTPKPLEFIKAIIDQMSYPDDIIIDFFAGSGTTAHAAYALNKNDGGIRKVILMESNDAIPTDHIARKHGFNILSDITKYRLDHLQNINNDFFYQTINTTKQMDNKKFSTYTESLEI